MNHEEEVNIKNIHEEQPDDNFKPSIEEMEEFRQAIIKREFPDRFADVLIQLERVAVKVAEKKAEGRNNGLYEHLLLIAQDKVHPVMKAWARKPTNPTFDGLVAMLWRSVENAICDECRKLAITSTELRDIKHISSIGADDDDAEKQSLNEKLHTWDDTSCASD